VYLDRTNISGVVSEGKDRRLPLARGREKTQRPSNPIRSRNRDNVAHVTPTMLVTGHDDAKIVERLAVPLVDDERCLATEIGRDLASRCYDDIAVLSCNADRVTQLCAFAASSIPPALAINDQRDTPVKLAFTGPRSV
jgi:hypothetical protein